MPSPAATVIPRPTDEPRARPTDEPRARPTEKHRDRPTDEPATDRRMSSATRPMSFNDDLDRERAQIMRRVRQASDGWAAAMRAHKLAPPDAGFAGRLRDLATAASNEQVAWEHAHAAGLMWRPVPGAESAAPPYELRPGTGRRGPPAIWGRFDAAVAALNRAITGSNAATLADAFGDLAEVTGELADAVARDDEAAMPRRGAA